MTREGVDYAWHGVLDVQAFQAAGVTFAMRYLSNDDSKNLHGDEAALLGSAGIDVGVVWETTETRVLAGRAGGAEDAGKAMAQAAACGMPDDRPIYFAVDYDAPDPDKPTIAQYLEGAAGVLGGVNRVGVYGGYWVIKYCLDHNSADYCWQTLAWSGGQRDPRAQLYQHRNGVKIGGIDCDLDTAYADDFGQWRVGTAPSSTTAPPFPYPDTDYLATVRADIHCHSGADTADAANIVQWQQRMAERGWRISATGIFDRESDRVCRKFQAEKGLVVDGEVGPLTWEAAWTSPVT